jgi:predicted transcriptional regulator
MTIATGTPEDFFARGKAIAKLLDEGRAVPDRIIVNFEEPSEFLRFLSTNRLQLFRSIKQNPGSITDLAKRLRRDRSAVKRDIDALYAVGLLHIELQILPGHGQKKFVRVTANSVQLEALVA